MVETEHLAGVISVSPAVRIPELLPIHREFPWFLRRPVFETAFWIGPRRMLPAFGSFRRERFPVAFETLKHMPGGEPGVAETALEDLGTGFIRVVRELELGERAALPLSREASRRFPPVLVLQGVRDGIIPVEFVRQFEASLEHVRRGRFEFQYLPFNTHFDILVDRMVIRRMIAWTHAVSRLPLAQVA